MNITPMTVWDYYFMSIYGWSLHPGNHQNDLFYTLEEMIETTNQIMDLREKVLQKTPERFYESYGGTN